MFQVYYLLLMNISGCKEYNMGYVSSILSTTTEYIPSCPNSFNLKKDIWLNSSRNRVKYSAGAKLRKKSRVSGLNGWIDIGGMDTVQ